ncbi:DinB family protein [Fibrella aquatilis]|uniref:DinB family protein n=1 Tax=Fibrella aquatilis TaxID=2817059 RepID=A0A939JY66_9BACT|nr:DinB family protein [Fibrella aquatilis]MBO0930038.1 DinB family protein [Fibrella aquatilis]
MNKTAITVMPGYFDRYINLVPNVDLLDALEQQASLESVLPAETMTGLGDFVYAPGKWTAKDIVQHLIDTERIMAYRALRFARADSTSLPGFEEDDFARSAHASRRTIPDLYAEFDAVRQATLAMYRSFDEEMLQRTGICAGQTMSVLALGFVLVGHPMHHARVVRDRYLS